VPAKTYKALGLMSGSSLDGLDLAFCEFSINNDQLDWNFLIGETLPFSEMWQARLAHLPVQNAQVYAKSHIYLGYYFGELCNTFLKKHKVQPDFIASHGHTIFHDPERRYSAQIGDGAAIAATTGIQTIDNFRTQDIALNGQGAPIAPIADRYLLKGYDFYLNLGGIVNISCNANNQFIAFDISGANQVLNRLANELGLPYDAGGQVAASGKLIQDLFAKSNDLEYLNTTYPKSLSNQWVQESLVPMFVDHEGSIPDKLCSMVHHIGFQIQQSIHQIVKKEKLSQNAFNMIATGGGAHNSFLMKIISDYNPNINIEIPDRNIIEFKEAIMIALMGVLRLEGIPNTIHTVTGAARDTISGAIHAGRPEHQSLSFIN
jgi:anhydro-N-acetylmuramic acid kinase